MGNITLAYPYRWRNDRWNRNVMEPQTGRRGVDNIPKGMLMEMHYYLDWYNNPNNTLNETEIWE